MFGYPLGNKLVWHDGLPKEDGNKFYEKRLWGCLGHQRLFTLLALRQLGERFGFRQEARFIENIFFKGAWGSECLFALLQRESQSNN